MYRQTLLRPPRSSWASNSCCSTSLLDREDQQTREVALKLYAQHMYRSPHRVDGDDLRQDFQFKTPVVDALAVWCRPRRGLRWIGQPAATQQLDQLTGPGCAQLLGEQRRPSDRGR
ncbi:hypothetical protein GN958_ATG03561 [Phytophthora infestans]|uniref:Uncharacterized protein n=1 Tax=Phytophthora infestans TaxID=4787 RepID=A0A8S9V2U2_PHYIN|nr:hypothetical protein GN958_ATG03561 [Phytophthora infestans]